jgi:putative ABC transport system permease protein
MNLLYLSFKNIVFKPLSSLLSILLFGFGVSIIVLILLVSTHLKNEINTNAQGIDLVVGAKGSPLQLILANIFHVDFPTGNISLKEAVKLSKNRLIQTAIPLSLGDSYAGYRIVGTTPAYLQLYNVSLATGSWSEGEMEAVIGSRISEKLGLKIGDTFNSTHGLSEIGAGHDDHPFTVTGIMAPSGTVLDELIVVSVASVWHVHGHANEHEEHADSLHAPVVIPHLGLTVTREQFENEDITSLLLKYASPMAAIRLPQMVNKDSNFQAASPAFETARLFNLIGTGVDVMNLLGLVIIIISAVSVFIALINSLKERKYELAIMRSMGASRLQVFLQVLLDGIFLTLAGIAFGFTLAHIGFHLLGLYVESMQTDGVFFVRQEVVILIGSFAVGIVSAIMPAFMAYRSDISKTLAKG